MTKQDGVNGTTFTVWAPQARKVSVVGDFNAWNGCTHRMLDSGTGIWQLFIPGVGAGSIYKYEIQTCQGELLLKADPYAFAAEVRPNSASVVTDLTGYLWRDQQWQNRQHNTRPFNKPVLIYEVHLGSWKRKDNGDMLSYRELAELLPEYAAEMGYTHLELLPVAEHPFDGSWGYQLTGYYAVTSRYGTSEDFMYFVDTCHRKNIGVILDWVPGHFCRDGHGLQQFDGTSVFEYQDKRQAENDQWGTVYFDLGRPEVQSFLISNALFWFDVFHVDGLRVDAVASMLYLDYGRLPGTWAANCFGGNENLAAVDFMKKLNKAVFTFCPQALMIAEESTAWPMVTKPDYLGGLGFNYKWNMGWMNDILKYMQSDPIYRKYLHNTLTFSLMYAFSENYVLALSHDEVVHGKKSLLDKMPGDYWQKFANLRLLYAYMMSHPGKKLLFMGGELGQFVEWRCFCSLDWELLRYDSHRKLQRYVQELNRIYIKLPAFWELDHNAEGFQWIDCSDCDNSIIVFMRRTSTGDFFIALCNFTPAVRNSYRIGVPVFGDYEEFFNSDGTKYGGSGQINTGLIRAENKPWQNQPYSLAVTVPPLAAIFLKTAALDSNDEEDGGKV